MIGIIDYGSGNVMLLLQYIHPILRQTLPVPEDLNKADKLFYQDTLMQ